jgi:hypothetical protein
MPVGRRVVLRRGPRALACEAASFICVRQLDRIALHVRASFPIATARLTLDEARELRDLLAKLVTPDD